MLAMLRGKGDFLIKCSKQVIKDFQKERWVEDNSGKKGRKGRGRTKLDMHRKDERTSKEPGQRHTVFM